VAKLDRRDDVADDGLGIEAGTLGGTGHRGEVDGGGDVLATGLVQWRRRRILPPVGRNCSIGMLEPDVGLETTVVDEQQVTSGERPGGVAAPGLDPEEISKRAPGARQAAASRAGWVRFTSESGPSRSTKLSPSTST
jgi:hypothetical protein